MLVLAALSLTFGAAGAAGNVSHAGWPELDTLWMADHSGQVGIGTDGNDELLGGNGSDTIMGGPGDDVIWGDQFPHPNGSRQHDVLRGGSGDDWIYTSHGTNTVVAGPGNDHLIGFWGHGTLDCGPGRDIVKLRNLHSHNYSLRHCEVVLPY